MCGQFPFLAPTGYSVIPDENHFKGDVLLLVTRKLTSSFSCKGKITSFAMKEANACRKLVLLQLRLTLVVPFGFSTFQGWFLSSLMTIQAVDELYPHEPWTLLELGSFCPRQSKCTPLLPNVAILVSKPNLLGFAFLTFPFPTYIEWC